jgi:RNA 3'-terminal phosphate cyclase
MGARGIRVEALAQTAFTQLIDWMSSDATVDPFLCDQILLAAVLAEGETIFKVSRLTQRFLTTAWVVKQFTPIHITIRGNEDGPGRVTVRR